MNFSESLLLNNENNNFINSKNDSKENSIKINKGKPLLLENSNKIRIISNDELNESNLKFNFEIIEENKTLNIKNNNNSFDNNINEKKEINKIKNNQSSLKIQIPLDVMDNHPIFIIQRINENNKNCIFFYNKL
jgi:hypothetical protein